MLKLEFSEDLIKHTQDWKIDFNEKIFENFLNNIEGIDVKNPVFYENKCNLWTGAKQHKTENFKGGNHGYFNLKINSKDFKTFGAHRLMYILAYGIPEDMASPRDPCPCGEQNTKAILKGSIKTYGSCCRKVVRHNCKEISGEDYDGQCVNPLHLKLGTQSENQHDIRKHGTGKGGVFKGETAYQAKYSDEQMKELWKDIQLREEQLQSREEKEDTSTITLLELTKKHNMTYNTVKDMKNGRSWNHITGIVKTKNEKRKERETKKFNVKQAQKREEDTSNMPQPKKPKLTDKNAFEIRDEYKKDNKVNTHVLAEKYNVSETTIRDVIKGKTFKKLLNDVV